MMRGRGLDNRVWDSQEVVEETLGDQEIRRSGREIYRYSMDLVSRLSGIVLNVGLRWLRFMTDVQSIQYTDLGSSLWLYYSPEGTVWRALCGEYCIESTQLPYYSPETVLSI